MTDGAGGSTADPMQAERTRAGSVTRGFLFADLRDYTRFIESHGAAVAADLLTRYRVVVRGAIKRFAGAEIRTEGDSFYVVFDSVSDAVQCGLAIVADAAATDAERPYEPIRVGVGIHAGETVETPEGYVGAPVNIAARLCALAEPGQVLVSDTVRALTQTVVPVAFRSIGKRQLKGVADPVAVFAATAAGSSADARDAERQSVEARHRRRRRTMVAGGVGAIAVVVVAAGFIVTRPAAGLPSGPWTIGLDGPLTGKADPDHLTTEAVTLAIDDQNAKGGIGGQPLRLDAHDDVGADGVQDPDKGAQNASAFVADPTVIAVIGSRASPVAKKMIPLTNAAGLLQCSPANSNPGLTKPRFGALDLRSSAPTRINYVRLAPADDIEGVAAATFAANDLKATSALVIDDTTDFGRESADAFIKAYEGLGGSDVRRSLNQDPTPTDIASALQPLTAPGANIGVVYFGGVTTTGAPALRKTMDMSGFSQVPFVGTDGLLDGPGSQDDSYVQQAGAGGAGSYALLPSIGPVKADFAQRFQTRFGTSPDDLAGAAYACTQVILQGLDAIAPTSPSSTTLREALRASVVDPSHRYETVLGTVGFDANGDNIQQFVTVYKDEPAAGGGTGDWIAMKQQDYGPAP